MQEPNNLYSNKHKKNIRNSLSRKDISAQQCDFAEMELREEKKAQENYEKYGLGGFATEGTIARLKAIPFNIPEQLIHEGHKISYHYGYYDRGTRLLAILIEERQVKTGNVEITSENFEIALRKIAINDGMNPEINFDSLPEVVKNNDIYAAGFIEGQLLNQQKKLR